MMLRYLLYKLFIIITPVLFFCQCHQKEHFEKAYYSVNIGLRKQSLNKGKKIRLLSKINRDVLNVQYYEGHKIKRNLDTIDIQYPLKQASIQDVKIFDINGRKAKIYRYVFSHQEITDSHSAVYLMKNKKILIIKSISWVRIYSFYTSEYEKKLINIILQDTTGFFNEPLPPTPPAPPSLKEE